MLGIAFGAAVACGSSDDQPPGSGATGGKGGKSGAGGKTGAGGKGGSSAGHAGEGATGGSDAGKGGGGSAGRGGTTASGGSSGRAGRGGTGSGATGGTTGNGEAGSQETGGTTSVGGTTAMGGESGDTGASGASGDGSGAQLTLSVHTSSGVRAISPLIYGVTPLDGNCAVPAAARFTLCRLGNNRWSSYDWENNASNAGGNASDACFVNDGELGGGDTAGAAVSDVVAQAQTAGAATLVTLPLLDYVAADKPGGVGDPTCTGAAFTNDQAHAYLAAHFRANQPVKGAAFVYPPDATDANVYSDEFVAHLRDNTNGAKLLFGLDNEPGVWNLTNGAAHPAHPTYAEVVEKNVAFAKSTRDQWPTAEIAGYVGYGYNDFVNLQGAPDADANGLFVDYYLTNLAQASATYGSRLIDYFDVHWFPELYVGPTRITSNDATPDFVALRMQATRSLWDPTYVEPGWITGTVTNGQPIRLLPWLNQRIAAGYPGTKLSVSAWSYGGGTDVSGAVAAADALGIFAQQGVSMAAFASQTGDDPYVIGAFEAFRNYDGAGASFGDTSVAATSSNVEVASVYASVDSTDASRVVVIAINRSETELPTKLSVDDSHAFATADVYTITSAGPTPAPAPALTAQPANTFTYVMPAYSVSVIVPKQ